MNVKTSNPVTLIDKHNQMADTFKKCIDELNNQATMGITDKISHILQDYAEIFHCSKYSAYVRLQYKWTKTKLFD